MYTVHFIFPVFCFSFYILLFLFFKPTQISRSRYLCGINFLNIVLSAFFLFYTVKYYAFTKVVPVKTSMGTMYSVQAIAEPSNFAIRFLEQKIRRKMKFFNAPRRPVFQILHLKTSINISTQALRRLILMLTGKNI